MATITEGLQEIKTLMKRIEKKREFIENYLWRHSQIRDAHEKNGGSTLLIAKERQAVKDLENNIIETRSRIVSANIANNITVCGDTRSIADWIIWKREISSGRKRFLESMYSKIQNARTNAATKGFKLVESEGAASEKDFIVHLDEKILATEIEKIVEIISTLDGQLSLKNATIVI